MGGFEDVAIPAHQHKAQVHQLEDRALGKARPRRRCHAVTLAEFMFNAVSHVRTAWHSQIRIRGIDTRCGSIIRPLPFRMRALLT